MILIEGFKCKCFDVVCHLNPTVSSMTSQRVFVSFYQSCSTCPEPCHVVVGVNVMATPASVFGVLARGDTWRPLL